MGFHFNIQRFLVFSEKDFSVFENQNPFQLAQSVARWPGSSDIGLSRVEGEVYSVLDGDRQGIIMGEGQILEREPYAISA